ncbi:MAG: S8 family peptidase [Vicinamibacterales bacterium]
MPRVWNKAVWGAAVAIWLMVPAPGAASGHEHRKIDRLLTQQSSNGPRRVIIRTKSGAKAVVKARLQGHGDSIYGDHEAIDALSAKIHADDLASLVEDPDIESISADAPVSASQFSLLGGSDDGTSTLNELKTTLGLSGLLSGYNITIAVIDSGLAPGIDFDGRILGFYDFSNGKPGIYGYAFDDYGHGTHVAGLIASNGKTSDKRYAGIATRAKLLPLKVLDRNGAGFTSDVIRALEFAIANKDRFNIRVVNLSLGHPIYESAATDPLVQAVERAVRAGLIVVTAAGNYGTNPTTRQTGYAGIASPGNAPSAITVGAASTNGTAVRGDDRVSRFSSRGPSWYDGIAKPDILAPGDGMISNSVLNSTLALTYPSLLVTSGSSKYLRLSGSSMATGVVSGVVALMLEANQYGDLLRSLESWFQRTPYTSRRPSANAIKAMLQYTATPLRDAGGNRYDYLTQGSGLVNGIAAVTMAGFADTAKAPGAFWLPTTLQPWTRFDNTDEAWSQTVIWGTRLVQGSSVIELNQFAWSDNIVWGTGELDNLVWGTFSGDNLVWGSALSSFDVSWFGNAALGDNIVWGTADWADNIVWGTSLIGFFDGDNIVWGTFSTDNIVWGTLSDDNIVWGTNDNTVTILGSSLIGGGL